MGKNRNKNSRLEKLIMAFSVLIICIITKSYCNITPLNSQDTEFNFRKQDGRNEEGAYKGASYFFVGTLPLCKNVTVDKLASCCAPRYLANYRRFYKASLRNTTSLYGFLAFQYLPCYTW